MTRLNLLVLIFVVVSCKNENDPAKIYEGIIEYDIAYSNDSSSSLPIRLLPKKMILQFNRHYASYKIEDMMGIFCITNITDLSSHTHVSTVKMFNSKYRYESGSDEMPVFFKPQSIYYSKETEDTTTLAGVCCYKSVITDIKERRNFVVAYSNNFLIKQPNVNTPYRDINGVLMKFEIDLGKMKLHLTAKKIIPSKINDKIFKIHDDYKAIPQKKMREIIATMIR